MFIEKRKTDQLTTKVTIYHSLASHMFFKLTTAPQIKEIAVLQIFLESEKNNFLITRNDGKSKMPRFNVTF